MNRRLYFSLFLNALLLPALGWQLWHQAAAPTPSTPAAETNPAQAPAVPGIAPAFHWSQIESPEYPAFIANLRSIGCPEHTIRHIVDGELRLIYAEQAAAKAAQGPPASMASPEQIEQERLALLDQVLQPSASAPARNASRSDAGGSDSVSTSSSPTSVSSPAASPTLTNSIPAAFLLGDDGSSLIEGHLSTAVTDPNLSPADAEQISRLRTDFEAAVMPEGQAAPAPDSREYLRRWRRAQWESDDRFSSLYGGDALNALHRQQLLQASQAGNRQ